MGGIGQLIVVSKAILTRIIFATHGLIAIWRVTTIKNDPYYWYLCASILALGFEGVYTLTIKENQEWKWFCPSVFLYLASVVPAIWLLEVDKFDRKLSLLTHVEKNHTKGEELAAIETFGVELKIPVELDSESWTMVIEQLLMLILIIGRWMLPRGELTRDQLSQLLLVYIGTAADILEFFDSFKDDKVASQRVLCLLILSIWSWSLLQFTFVLTATKSRRMRLTTDIEKPKPLPKFINGVHKAKEVCCTIDVWGILINIILQDAPFLIFRMLLITYYKLISYMNIFFTSKNTLVIILQFYRLYVVQQEKNKELSKKEKVLEKTIANNNASSGGGGGGAGGTASLSGAPVPKKSKSKGKSRASNKVSPVVKRVKQTSKNAKPVTKTAKSSSRGSSSQESAIKRENKQRSLKQSEVDEWAKGTAEVKMEAVVDDDIEMGASAVSIYSSEDVAPLDNFSVVSESSKNTKKTRSMGSSEKSQVSGYSSSSKDSEVTSRQGTTIVAKRGVSRNSQMRPQVVRRYSVHSSLNSREFQLKMKEIEGHENERIFQRRAAICAVFSLFVVIFILCMVAIYGGINQKGLVLRENFRIANSTRPRTTTSPTTATTSRNRSTVVSLTSKDSIQKLLTTPIPPTLEVAKITTNQVLNISSINQTETDKEFSLTEEHKIQVEKNISTAPQNGVELNESVTPEPNSGTT